LLVIVVLNVLIILVLPLILWIVSGFRRQSEGITDRKRTKRARKKDEYIFRNIRKGEPMTKNTHVCFIFFVPSSFRLLVRSNSNGSHRNNGKSIIFYNRRKSVSLGPP